MIRTPSQEACFRIWENGFDLLTYLIAEAAPELSQRYKAACASLVAPTDGQDDPLARLSGVLREAAQYRGDDVLMLQSQQFLIVDHPFGHWRSHRELFKLLQSEVLAGFGFTEPRRTHDAPKPVPADIWRCSIDWETSTVKGNGLSYAGVRIVSKCLIDQILADVGDANPSKPVGRPGVRQHISEAFDALISSGVIDLSEPMSRVYDPTRQWLATSIPERAEDFRSLSNETIRLAIRSEFKRLRQAKKQ